MKKDTKWLKEKVQTMIDKEYRCYDPLIHERKHTCRVIMDLIEQIDEPETLNEEWINEHSKSYTMENAVEISDLKKLLLPQPKKPVIPKFVADWIDAHNLHGNNPLREYRDLENDFNEGWTDEEDAAVYHWVNKNPYTFIDALRYGYEVEKEKMYYIYDKSTKGYLGYNADKTRLSWYTSQFPNDVFTEQEIKEIDERYWAFAEEVTE